jgi:mycothiol synthase
VGREVGIGREVGMKADRGPAGVAGAAGSAAGESETGAFENLIARARAFDGSPPFSDGALVELAQGHRELVWLDQAVAVVDSSSAEFVVDPDARRHGLGARMLEQLTSAAAGDMLFWAHGNHPGARALAASHGLRLVRELLHLEADAAEADLPADGAPQADPPEADVHAATAIRQFATGDETAWLDLNASAFAHHPEQGGMTRAALDIVMAESWFDPEDFLLLWDDATLIGYCWLKVENGEGEFYVVGVDPKRQGEGLGRILVSAGMKRLTERRIRSAHLYVEGDNTAALRLYRSFGFRERSIDVQYLWKHARSG